MAQESILRVGVDSRDAVTGAERGERALDGLGRKAQRTETQFQRLERTMSGMRGVFAALGVGLAAREFGRLLDVSTNINNRLRLVTDTTEELNAVYGELLRISNETRTDLEVNAQLFNRVALSAKNLGLTYGEVIDFTEKLNKAVVISGATTAEASAALIQLSQGLASGTLRGDELRSVLEQLPKVADVIAEGLGVTRGELRKLGEEGKISAKEVIDAFKKVGAELDAEFAEIVPTISSAFTVLRNQAIDYVNTLNQASGVGELIARSILFLADNFNALAGAVAGVAIIITGALLGALAKLTVALAANPVGALVVGFAALTAALGYFGDKTVEVGDKTATVWQIIKAAVITAVDIFKQVWEVGVGMYQAIAEAGEGFVNASKDILSEWLSDWGITLDDIGQAVKAFINFSISSFVAMFRSIGRLLEGIPDLWRLALEGSKKFVKAGVQDAVNIFVEGIAVIGDALDFISFDKFDVGGKIRGLLRMDIPGATKDLTDLKDKVAAIGADIGKIYEEELSADRVGKVTAAISGLGAELGERFNANLEDVIKNTEASVNLQEILSRKFGDMAASAQGAGEASKTAIAQAKQELKAYEDALDSVKDKFDDFTSTIDSDFTAWREAHGQAAQVAREWYEGQQMILTELSTAYDTYAGQLEAVFQNRLATAKDADKVKVIAWYEEQRAILEALNIDYSSYAEKLEVLFNERLAEARDRDLQNATDWRSGIERAIKGFGGEITTEASIAESAMNQLFSSVGQGLNQMLETGKLDFKAFAASVIADIARVIAKMLLMKALKTALGMADGGSVGGAPGAAPIPMPKPGFASGGMVSGPGGPRSDSILSWLSDGEFVVNAKSTEMFLPLLEAINNRDVPGMRDGGLLAEGSPIRTSSPKQTGGDERSSGEEPVNLKLVNVLDPAIVGDFLQTDAGERLIINTIQRSGVLER